MALPAATPAQRARLHLFRHPETPAAALVVVAWVTLVVISIDSSPRLEHERSVPMPGMPDMRIPAAHPPGFWNLLGHGSPYWLVMTIAMMGPAALPGITHTAVNSLSWRRRLAMLEYSAGYLAIWVAYGAAALTAAALVPSIASNRGLGVVLVAAAIWQITPVKRQALRNCHRSIPLPLTGPAADRAAFRFGATNSAACLASCWCLMLVMIAAPHYQLAWTVALSALIITESSLLRPLRFAHAIAIPLTAVAALCLL